MLLGTYEFIFRSKTFSYLKPVILDPHAHQVLETLGIISASMAVAVTFPTQAEKIFALTGSTAVCLACYCIPVYIHLKLEERLDRHGILVGDTVEGLDNIDTAPLLDDAAEGSEVRLPKAPRHHHRGRGRRGSMQRLIGPSIIVIVGVGCSAAGLYVSLRDMWEACFKS